MGQRAGNPCPLPMVRMSGTGAGLRRLRHSGPQGQHPSQDSKTLGEERGAPRRGTGDSRTRRGAVKTQAPGRRPLGTAGCPRKQTAPGVVEGQPEPPRKPAGCSVRLPAGQQAPRPSSSPGSPRGGPSADPRPRGHPPCHHPNRASPQWHHCSGQNLSTADRDQGSTQTHWQGPPLDTQKPRPTSRSREVPQAPSSHAGRRPRLT